MHFEVAMTSTSQHVVIGGWLLPQEDLKHTDPPTFQGQQVDIIMALREEVQNPPLGLFNMEDLVWTNHITNRKGRHMVSQLAVILRDRLDKFISSKQRYPLYIPM